MARCAYSMVFHFHGKLFYPPGCRRIVDPRATACSADKLEEVYVEMKSALLEHGTFRIVADGWLAATFFRCGDTAGYMRLSQAEDEEQPPLHAFAVFMSGLDATDDRAALESICNEQVLNSIPPEAFALPAADECPYAALYFANQRSLDCAPLYDMIKVAYAAFFDQFGMGATR